MRAVSAVVAFSLLLPNVAFAVDKQACTEAFEKTQKLKKQGALGEAKKSALFCAQEGCPAFIRDECTSLSVDIEKSLSTIVVGIVDASGKDVTDATVALDGNAIAHDGKAIAVDPGPHKLRVEPKGGAPIEQELVAREGEKNRVITVQLPPTAAKPAAPSPAEPPPSAPTARPVPAATWIFAGLGVAGLATFATFGAIGLSRKSDLDSRGCKPDCPQADVDKAKRSFLVADIGLGVGLLGAGVATVMYLTRGEQPGPTDKPVGKRSFDVAAGPRGATATFTLRF